MSATPPRTPNSEPSLRCAEVAPYLAAFADDELAEPLRARVATHVATCESCSRQVARYATLDALVATLPRTAPSPEVFERVSAAVAGRESLPAVRESLAGRRPALRRRRLEFAEWADAEPAADAAHPRAASRPGVRRGWRAGALPTIAAMLLVALTALTIRGAIGFHTSSSALATPTPSGTALDQTQAQMQRAVVGYNLGFTEVVPSYLPSAPVYLGVHAQVTPSDPGSGAMTLDVTWAFSGPVQTVHLREGASATRWSGYFATPERSGLTWQVGTYQWTPLTVGNAIDRPAVGQDRGSMWLALDATVSSGDPKDPRAIALLRLISLSMDMPYQPDPQQIIAPPSSAVFHYSGQMAVGGNWPSYDVNGYDAETQQASSITLSRGGAPYYTDVVSGQQGIRIDPAHRTYQAYPRAQLTPAALPHGVTQVFFDATTLALNGDLWNAGQTTYGGAKVYDYRWVYQPRVTHVYVDQQSKQVIAVVVDPSAAEQPGGSGGSWWYAGESGCTSYSLIEALPSVLSSTFSVTPPTGYTQGQVPATLTC
jgi:hypothetical protein